MPARLLVKESTETTERPPEDLSELRDRPCWLDISDPQSKDFELAARELHLHPLAVEDAQQRHERPKIDQYDDHYFIVFYALHEASPGVVREVAISIFMKQNAIVTVHEATSPHVPSSRSASAREAADHRPSPSRAPRHDRRSILPDRRHARRPRRAPRDVDRRRRAAGLRHLDPGAVRAETRLAADPPLIAPERDVLTVLVRGDILELREPGRRAYYQDVYDHLSRVTDEIDTFRELTSNVIDAHLASISNRLNEVVKVLTSIATVLLVLTAVTGSSARTGNSSRMTASRSSSRR